jgi:hypothetical protein
MKSPLFNCQRTDPIALTPRTPKPGLRGDPGAAWADGQTVLRNRLYCVCYRTFRLCVNVKSKNIFSTKGLN